jgi:molybdenum storage protein
MRESLMDKQVLAATGIDEELRILPDVNVVAIGGRSILDRGKAALAPLLDEVVRCRRDHKIVLGVGAGARTRHTYHIASDLGLPVGGLAMVAGAVNEQNRYMVQALLARHGGVVLHKDDFVVLPLSLEAGLIPIMSGMPPYHYWEPPGGERRIPAHGEDFGMYMVAEAIGARSVIFVKDQAGLCTADPRIDPRARLIPEVGADELLEMGLPDLIIERAVVETMLTARHVRRVQIINGLEPGRCGVPWTASPSGPSSSPVQWIRRRQDGGSGAERRRLMAQSTSPTCPVGKAGGRHKARRDTGSLPYLGRIT